MQDREMVDATEKAPKPVSADLASHTTEKADGPTHSAAQRATRPDAAISPANGAEILAAPKPMMGTPGEARLATAMQGSVGNARVGRIAQVQTRVPGPEPTIQRQRRRGGAGGQGSSAPTIGTPFAHPAGSHSPFRMLAGDFDGREFVLKGDGTELMRTAAASGRPVAVRPADARRCGGATSESYLNNPRYVGIADYGPIPEGVFFFKVDELGLFSLVEQAQFTAGGQFTDPFGQAMHGGDWGAGRAQLHKRSVVPIARGCGNTARRSGFFIHGGFLTGSSGCIDIGNAGIAALLPFLTGFRGPIAVTVRYRHPPTSVGTFGRTVGGFVYPGHENPTLEDRLRGAAQQLFGGDDD